MNLKVETEEDHCAGPAPLDVFASRSTLHGLAHIFTYERFGVKRLLWLLLLLGSFSFLLCVCVERVRYYFAYPHVTKLDEVSMPRMVFPAITFCNLNEFRFSRVTRNDLYHAGELLALLNNRYEIQDPHLAEESVLESLQDKANFRNFKPKPFNMREFFDRTGHDIREMLLYCRYRGETCSAEDFKAVSLREGRGGRGVARSLGKGVSPLSWERKRMRLLSLITSFP
ncbi:acid-sensing ion channel 1-like [Polyodon spathula]|uniref:acid-sensing ion channel 1-like n=1 Tax=Polyodon spathula TaxID=7913 RepID=UPI001B7ED6F0|nr:acid-sensing ion channel 1-like [Polyodon spathula]